MGKLNTLLVGLLIDWYAVHLYSGTDNNDSGLEVTEHLELVASQHGSIAERVLLHWCQQIGDREAPMSACQ